MITEDIVLEAIRTITKRKKEQRVYPDYAIVGDIYSEIITNWIDISQEERNSYIKEINKCLNVLYKKRLIKAGRTINSKYAELT